MQCKRIQPFVKRESRRWKPETASHSASTVRKQRDESWYPTGFLLFIPLRKPALGRVPDMVKVGQPTFLSLMRIIFHGHAQKQNYSRSSIIDVTPG